MRFSKGTLHYMKKNAERNEPFTLNKHVRERLDRWTTRLSEAYGRQYNPF
jgi:CRISPR-associated protein Cas1